MLAYYFHFSGMDNLPKHANMDAKFFVGTGLSDAERKNPPKIGSIITFRYFEIIKKSGVPRFPSYLREKVVE